MCTHCIFYIVYLSTRLTMQYGHIKYISLNKKKQNKHYVPDNFPNPIRAEHTLSSSETLLSCVCTEIACCILVRRLFFSSVDNLKGDASGTG